MITRQLMVVLGCFMLGVSLLAQADVEVIDFYDQQKQVKTQPLAIEQRVATLEKQVGSAQQLEWMNRLAQLQRQFETLQGQIELQSHRLAQLQQTVQQFQQPAVAQASDQQASLLTGNEKTDYQTIYQLMMTRAYEKARAGFVSFLARYPASHYGANAYYWLGELQLKSLDYEQALTSFSHVVRDHPKSLKVSDALLKQGYIYYSMGKWSESRKIFEQVSTRYPNSSGAKLALSRLKEMNSQGL